MVGPRVNPLSVLCAGMLMFCVVIVVGLIVADVMYLAGQKFSAGEIWKLFTAESILRALRLSLITSLTTRHRYPARR